VTNCTEAGLLAEIGATPDGGSIVFDCGGPATIRLSRTIQIARPLRIDGDGEVTLSGGRAVRIFNILPQGALELANLTIAEGAGGESGGAILNQGSLSVENVTFIGNRAAEGGAIYSTGSTSSVEISDSAFYDNSASGDGGAISMALGSTLTLSGSTLRGNVAGGRGGAIYNTGVLTVRASQLIGNRAASGGAVHSTSAAASILESALRGNQAQAGGGGVRNEGTLALGAVELSENSAGSGGGVDSSGELRLANSTVSGNRASGNGGGITSRGTLLLGSVTVAANSAAGDGGGVYIAAGTGVLSGTLLAANSDAGGDAPDCSGPLTSQGYNLIGNTAGCTIGGDTTGNILDTDPRIGPLADNGGPTRTHALLLDSPAMNKVPTGTCFPIGQRDQRGIGRPVGKDCDIGAYEQGFVVNTLADAHDYGTRDAECTTDETGQFCSLRAAIEAANGLPGPDAITFAIEGVFVLSELTPHLTDPDGGDLDITDDTLLIGLGSDRTIIDGGDNAALGGLLYIAPGANVTITGVTLRNGATPDRGGAIHNDGVLTLLDSEISSSSAAMFGGGIANASQLTVLRSTIRDNTAATFGGGIYNTGTLIMRDSTVSGNAAQGSLGGGGGIDTSGVALLENVTVSDNTAANGGGGINVSGGGPEALRMNNVTIAGNVADADADGIGDGGGIRRQMSSGAVRFSNTLIAGNEDRSKETVHHDCSGALDSLGYNLIGVSAGCAPDTAPGDRLGGIVPIDARLGPLRDNGGPTETRALLPGSPAINAGSPSLPGGQGNACAASDQRGRPRPEGAVCDIGASEAPLADVRVQQAMAPSALIGHDLLLTTTVTNTGPSPTDGVVVRITRPPYTALVSASAARGGCTTEAGITTCTVGTLASGASVTVELLLRPVNGGPQTSSASVTAAEADPDSENNSATALVRVAWPLYIPAVSRPPS